MQTAQAHLTSRVVRLLSIQTAQRHRLLCALLNSATPELPSTTDIYTFLFFSSDDTRFSADIREPFQLYLLTY